MRAHAGHLLRAIALLLTEAADRLDPQPQEPQATFTIYGDGSHSPTGVWNTSGNVKWHRTG